MIQERKDIYAKAFFELNEIIKYMNKELQNKIPIEIKKDLFEAMDKDYEFNYNETKPLYKQELMPETKNLLSIIYSEYLCSEEEKRKWDEYDKFCLEKKNEIKLKKYNPDNLFKVKENREKNENLATNLPIEIKKNRIFSKLKNFISRIFFNKKNY